MGQKSPLFIRKTSPTDAPNVSPILLRAFSVIQKWSLSLPIWGTVPRLLPPAAALLHLFHGCAVPLLLSARRRAASSALGKSGGGGVGPKGGGKSGLGRIGEEWRRRSNTGHTHRSTPLRQRGSGARGRRLRWHARRAVRSCSSSRSPSSSSHHGLQLCRHLGEGEGEQ
jgi:hypothetical protein